MCLIAIGGGPFAFAATDDGVNPPKKIMTQEIEIIQKALTLFSSDEKGLYWKGRFVSLSVDLPQAAFQEKNLSQPAILISYIVHDIWNIGTIIHRLSWLRTASIDEKFLDNMWLPYASVDIEHFHVELRSIMDYVAKIVARIANKYGQVPETFRKLLNWVSQSQGNRNRLGEDLATVVESARWFLHLRGVRDTLIHSGGFTLVFGSPKDGILFQVFKDHIKNLIDHKTLMFNENVVYFERYAAIYLAHLFVFLELLAEVIYQRHELKPIGHGASCSSPGFYFVVGWMNSLKDILEKG